MKTQQQRLKNRIAKADRRIAAGKRTEEETIRKERLVQILNNLKEAK